MGFRRISMISGPGSSKSTLSAGIFYELKKQNVSIEIIGEFAKEFAYEKRTIFPYSQLQIFSEQLTREHRVLNSDKDIKIVTDSSLILSIIYSKKYSFRSWKSLLEIYNDFDDEYPSLNFLVKRGDLEYNQLGRFENYNEALTMDLIIEQFLKENNIPYIPVKYNELDVILNHVKLLTSDNEKVNYLTGNTVFLQPIKK